MPWRILGHHFHTSPWWFHRPKGTKRPHRHLGWDDNDHWATRYLSLPLKGETFDRLTNLVIEFRQLNFHFVPLEEVILCLLTHWWNQIKLPGHRVCFLIYYEEGMKTKREIIMKTRMHTLPFSMTVLDTKGFSVQSPLTKLHFNIGQLYFKKFWINFFW